MYKITKDCYWIGASDSLPTVEEVPGVYSYKEAYEKTFGMCLEECRRLNAGDGNRFRSQSLGDQYDMAVLLWIGDDYRVVTGYNIVPIKESC